MTRLVLAILMSLLPVAALAESVVPTRTIRANDMIEPQDLTLKPIANPNAFTRIHDVVGQEARVTLYAGRPILFDDIGPPAVVSRNEIVVLRYQTSGLTILTEGRSLERGGIGDRIRIMNLDSRTTLFGQIQEDGSVRVFN
jgi:flagella basal body P-ring formation protein FlgA